MTFAPAACSARAVAAPRPDAPPATSAFAPPISMGEEASPGGRCGSAPSVTTSRRCPRTWPPAGRGWRPCERNRTVTAYSHVRVSEVRVVETVLVPRLAVITTRPEQPCDGDTVVGRRSVPVARKEYGAVRSRLGRSDSEQPGRREPPHGHGAHDARRLPGGVHGDRDQRVAAHVPAPRLVRALVRRGDVLADHAVVVEELHLGEPAVVGRVDAQRRRGVRAQRRGGVRERSTRAWARDRRTARRARPRP